MALSDEGAREIATEFVRSYLEDGIEYLTISENLADVFVEINGEILTDFTEYDYERVYGVTGAILKELAGCL